MNYVFIPYNNYTPGFNDVSDIQSKANIIFFILGHTRCNNNNNDNSGIFNCYFLEKCMAIT